MIGQALLRGSSRTASPEKGRVLTTTTSCLGLGTSSPTHSVLYRRSPRGGPLAAAVSAFVLRRRRGTRSTSGSPIAGSSSEVDHHAGGVPQGKSNAGGVPQGTSLTASNAVGVPQGTHDASEEQLSEEHAARERPPQREEDARREKLHDSETQAILEGQVDDRGGERLAGRDSEAGAASPSAAAAGARRIQPLRPLPQPQSPRGDNGGGLAGQPAAAAAGGPWMTAAALAAEAGWATGLTTGAAAAAAPGAMIVPQEFEQEAHASQQRAGAPIDAVNASEHSKASASNGASEKSPLGATSQEDKAQRSEQQQGKRKQRLLAFEKLSNLMMEWILLTDKRTVLLVLSLCRHWQERLVVTLRQALSSRARPE